MGMVPAALGLLQRSLAGAGAQHSEGTGCRAGAEKLEVVSWRGVGDSGSSGAGVQVGRDLSLCCSPLLLWLCRWMLAWGCRSWEKQE